MTQQMINGPSAVQPGIWNLTSIKTWLYVGSFEARGESGLFAQVVYPEITVTKKQHAVCYKMLERKLGELKEIQGVIRKNSEMNVVLKMVKPIDERTAMTTIAVPMTIQHVENATSKGDRLKPLFCVNITASSVKKETVQDTSAPWVFNGLKRRDRMAENGKETQWNPPDFGPKGKSKSGADRSGSTSTTTPDPSSV